MNSDTFECLKKGGEHFLREHRAFIYNHGTPGCFWLGIRPQQISTSFSIESTRPPKELRQGRGFKVLSAGCTRDRLHPHARFSGRGEKEDASFEDIAMTAQDRE